MPRWEVPDKSFAPLKLGTLMVPAGLQTLRVSATPGIEIQSVRLTRVQKEIASLWLPSIFSDHMVLLCEIAAPLRGLAVNPASNIHSTPDLPAPPSRPDEFPSLTENKSRP